MLDPSVDSGMVDGEATLNHHLFQVPVTERVPEVPAHAKQDDLGLVMPIPKGFVLAHE